MLYLLCRNKVADFQQWKRSFDSHANAHHEAGLYLLDIWRNLEDRHEVFFTFEVRDLNKARAFISAPAAAASAQAAGLLEGEYHFLESIRGY